MPADFDIVTFFPDGEDPEISQIETSHLSKRWLDVCSGMLDDLGPVFKHNMGSTLAHFDVCLAGPMGRLLVFGKACYEFCISLGESSDQDSQALDHFLDFLKQACKTTGSELSPVAIAAFSGRSSAPSLMMFDYCNSGIGDDQKLAIGQLGIHLANAYYDYCHPELGAR